MDKIDRYVFLGQFVDDKLEPCESVMHVKSIPKTISVTAGVISNTITEEISNQCLQNVYSVMADTKFKKSYDLPLDLLQYRRENSAGQEVDRNFS